MLLKKYPKNEEGRDFVVGDLHGCYDKLNRALKTVEFVHTKDRLFSVGDLVDRGEQNMECLRLLRQPWFYAIRGNHEDMMIDSVLRLRENSLWEMNGGAWTHEEDTHDLEELCDLADELPYAMEVETEFGRVGIVHADPPSDWNMLNSEYSDHLRQRLSWSRNKIRAANTEHIKGIDYVYCGHTPVAMPVSFGNVIYIDTGAVFEGIELLNGRKLEGHLTMCDMSETPSICSEIAWAKVKEELKKKGKGLHD